MFEFDREGRYLEVWTGEPGLLTRPSLELRGQTVVETLGPEMGALFVRLFERVIDTGIPETLDYTLDVQAGRRNFRCEARRGGSPNAVPTATLLVRDVTAETELKAKLLEAERLAAMGLLAASIGHEIRQPLAFATSSIEVLSRERARSGENDHAAEALDHVRDAVRRIGEIAANVRVIAPDRVPQRTAEVRRPILAAVDLCASEIQGRATVVTEIPDLPKVRANEGELCQVMTNLLLNAAHAGAPSAASRIVVRAVHLDAEGLVRISVEDEGRGIDPAHLGRIFDPFYTTKGAGGGTGLGLFVSRRIVEACGGTLEVDSTLHRGTTVYITLGVAANDPAPPSSIGTKHPPDPRRLRILVIDDERPFLRSLELVLGDAHEVVVESRSSTALAMVLAEPRRFDAILCDLSMPEIDGVAFYQHMETLGIASRFVLMTAGAFTPRAESFLRDVKVRRIVKPFAIETLLSVLASASAPAP